MAPTSVVRLVSHSHSRTFEVQDEGDENLLRTAKRAVRKAKDIYLPTSKETKSFTWLDWFGFFLPCVTWLRTYDIRNWLMWDIVAGLSVGAMVIPQGMSYANLAGMPYVYGLYGAFVPCIVYALFGSSRQLAVGPVAVTSMLLGNGLSNMFDFVNEDPNKPTDPEAQDLYNRAAIQVAFIAGLMYTAVGLLRLGWLTNFLSHTTISGFMSGACITIALSQVKYILGVKLPRTDQLTATLDNIFSSLAGFQWREFVMGMAFIFLLLAFKFLGGRFKRLSFFKAIGPLTVCVVSIALMNIFGWYEPQGPKNKPLIKNIGNIPEGLPPFTASWFFPMVNVSKQIILAIIVCLIDICESISIARALAQKNHYKLNSTQELRGLGYANIVGSLFACYTTTGSFSRSAVNNSVGAKTLISSFTTGIMLMVTLLVLTPVFENMSQNVQGAIIIVGVLQLFDFAEWLYLWKYAAEETGLATLQVNKLDWLVWNAVFLTVLFLGIEPGIGVGVGLSLIIVIYKSAFPRIVTLGRLPNSTVYRNTKMYADAEAPPGILVIRIDAPIYYANVENIKDYIMAKVESSKEESEKEGIPIRHIVLDLSPVTDCDATGVHFMHDFLRVLSEEGIKLAIANPSRQVLGSLRRGDIIKKIGLDAVHVNVHDAVLYCQGQLERSLKEETVNGV